ncbi:MAG TPA: uroporphyrinogen decarboxylase [Acidimicrobiia bacterium]|nr:uroporphyrinogen decarboxylase [Acidimicrobiia bacterium]
MTLILDSLALRPVDRRPIWVMRQAGRYLPEYRELRSRHAFQDAIRDPKVASEITLQPIRRFGFDGAIMFADIMTPLEAMGIDMTFDPGPKLRPMSLAEIADLPDLDLDRVGHVAETLRMVRTEVPDDVTVIGFAGAPTTLLAYLLEGGGSKEYLALRTAMYRGTPELQAALTKLSNAMHSYLEMQIDAGAQVVQLFDSWAGILPHHLLEKRTFVAARDVLTGLDAPTIYFAPGAGHALGSMRGVGASAYGVDWRTPIDEAWDRLGSDVAIQGNLDPAVLLTDPDRIRDAVNELLARTTGRHGHIVNLGHGIDRHTPLENVAALVNAVKEAR